MDEFTKLIDEIVFEASQHFNAENVERPFQGSLWKLPGSISARIQIFIQNMGDVHKVVVILGIDVNEFENEWIAHLADAGLEKYFRDDSPLAIATYAIPSLRSAPRLSRFPTVDEVAELRRWIRATFETSAKFPNTLDELANCIRQGRIIDIELWRFLGHPVKVKAFVRWLRIVKKIDVAEQFSRILSNRIEPYELVVDLPWP